MKALSDLPDNQLIIMFRNGSENAFNMLFGRHKNELYSVILFYVKDTYLAEDILQDVFIRVIRSIKSGIYNEQGKFLPWALRVSYNLCLDHMRQAKRKPTFLTDDYARWAIDGDDSGAENRMIRQQSEERMKYIMESLPEDQKMVITYRHFEDMSFKEIAQAMNTSVNTALGRMRYGMNNLRKLINTDKKFLFQ